MTRSEKAYALFKEGYNCCQAVVLSFSDFIAECGGPGEEQLKALCSGFGGGIGRLREVCGTVSGMTILAGFICPAPPEDKAAKASNYALVQSFAARFREQTGSIVCRELLGLPVPSHTGEQAAGESGSGGEQRLPIESPVPSERTAEYYRKRPCAELCALAASIVEEYLVENGRLQQLL